MKNDNKHIGSDFDKFLEDEELLDDANAYAKDKLDEWEIDRQRREEAEDDEMLSEYEDKQNE